MQNSVLKLIAIAGVVGIGSLVVMEVHKQLPQPGAVSADSADQNAFGASDETGLLAETTLSDFERATQGITATSSQFADTIPSPAGNDTDPFGEQFDFTEADVDTASNVDVAVDRNALTGDVDPFAPTEFDANLAGTRGHSVPVRPVGFDTETAGENQTAAAAGVQLDSQPFEPFEPDPAAAPSLSFDDDSDPFAMPAAEDIAEPVLDNPFEENAASNPADDVPPANTGRDTSRDPNSLQFLPSMAPDRSDSSLSRNQSDANSASELDFSTPFAADEEKQPEPEPAIRLDLDGSSDESSLQPTPNFDLSGDQDTEPFNFEGEARQLDSPSSADDSPEDFFADEPGNENMFDDPAVDVGEALPFFEEDEADKPEPRDVPDFNFDEADPLPALPDNRIDLPSGEAAPERVLPNDLSRRGNSMRDNRRSRRDTRPAPSASQERRDFDNVGQFPVRTAPDPRGRSRVPRFEQPRDNRRQLRQPPTRDLSRTRTFEPRDRRSGNPPVEIRPRGYQDNNDAPPARRPRRNVIPASATTTSGTLRPHLTVRKDMPESATRGVPLTYVIVVTNEGRATANNVVVEDTIPESARVEEVRPPVEFLSGSRTLQWEFEEIAAGETRQIQVRLTPTGQGVLDTVATVRFKAEVRTQTAVVAPELVLDVQVEREIKLGNETQLRYVITNVGDGTATDVVLRSDLPDGLRHPVGNDLEYSVGTLAPNEEREVVLDVIAAKPGPSSSKSELLAAGFVGDPTETSIHVVGQQVTIERMGPPRRYVGRAAVYENILTNDTSFPAEDVLVVEKVPDGMKFQRASHNGAWNPEDGTVVWKLATLPAETTQTLKVELIARTAGEQESSVMVIENAGFKTAARSVTAVVDINHVGVRFKGNERPVAVGEVFSFDITVQNRGTTRATGVVLTVDLPPGITGISSGKEGPMARPVMKGRSVMYRFDPVAIDAEDDRTFRINLKATAQMTDAPVGARIRYEQTEKELVTSETVTAYFDGPGIDGR